MFFLQASQPPSFFECLGVWFGQDLPRNCNKNKKDPTTTTFSGLTILPTQPMHVEEQIPQYFHRFALFHSSNLGNLMTPVFGGCGFVGWFFVESQLCVVCFKTSRHGKSGMDDP